MKYEEAKFLLYTLYKAKNYTANQHHIKNAMRKKKQTAIPDEQKFKNSQDISKYCINTLKGSSTVRKQTVKPSKIMLHEQKKKG